MIERGELETRHIRLSPAVVLNTFKAGVALREIEHRIVVGADVSDQQRAVGTRGARTGELEPRDTLRGALEPRDTVRRRRPRPKLQPGGDPERAKKVLRRRQRPDVQRSDEPEQLDYSTPASRTAADKQPWTRYEIKSWLGNGPTAKDDQYFAVRGRERAQRLAQDMIREYKERDVPEFEIGIFEARGNRMVWYFSTDHERRGISPMENPLDFLDE
jgi:hypothetical protein